MIHIIIYNETPAEPETTLEYQLRSWVKMHNTNIIISRYAYIMDIHDSLKEVVMDKLLIFYNAHDVEKGHAYADAIHTLNFKTNIISIAYDVRPETVEDVMEFPVNYLLLSPMKEHRLFNCLSLLAGASAPQYQSDFLVLKNKSGSVRFLLSEILYCCSDKRKVLIKETNGRISEFYCKLDELEEPHRLQSARRVFRPTGTQPR